ncbi:FkbM family methyltransferase [Microcoleus sp. PH2017_30_WIL_O_A]|uniref:FkbM family methyltransferase n=1 Tax=Microcoleus sp. PH2017_30_WIL_O_A TaxID=2798840 RepID=UPI001D650BCC|nr:FkbM family methyltransferase [Microcoleus sp. PH2017_30_WIL_O_A]MCC3584917.1 FkbM family methyltransferase [Microcoleus sp. PH2017_30_WIL_O_A]
MRSIHQFTNNPSGRPIIFVLDTGDSIGNAVANNQYQYSEAHEIIFNILKPGDRVLDLGGHIGTFSLVAAALGCQVVAVEASPFNAELIKASIAENNFHNMQVVCAAVSDRPGTLEFMALGPFGCVSNSHVNSGEKIIVPAMTVNQLLVDLGWDTVDYIKMDIEGSEVAAIAGMSELLQKDNAPVLLYESNGHTLNFFDKTPKDLVASLENLGYSNYFWKEEALVLFRGSDCQAENLVDYLAFKRIPDGLQGWLIRPSLTEEEIIDEAISCCQHYHQHHRAHTARVLATASHFILSNHKVINALKALTKDSNPDVRSAVSWFEGRLKSQETENNQQQTKNQLQAESSFQKLKFIPQQSEESTDLIWLVSSLATQLAQAQNELDESRSLFRLIYSKWEQAMSDLSQLQKAQIVYQIQQNQEEKEWLQSKYNAFKQTAQLLQIELKQSQLQLKETQAEIDLLQSQSKSIKFAGR